MRTIKTYFKGAPFYNAFLRTYPAKAAKFLASAPRSNRCELSFRIRKLASVSSTAKIATMFEDLVTSERIALKVARVGAVIASVLFWIMPLRTSTQVLLFIASIAVFLTCKVVLNKLDR
jgi:hypothetical protein